MGKRESEKKPRHPAFKHGHRNSNNGKPTVEYEVWAGILKRCRNPKCNIYQYYGGKGITFDPRWVVFQNFLDDVGFGKCITYSNVCLDCYIEFIRTYPESVIFDPWEEDEWFNSEDEL